MFSLFAIDSRSECWWSGAFVLISCESMFVCAQTVYARYQWDRHGFLFDHFFFHFKKKHVKHFVHHDRSAAIVRSSSLRRWWWRANRFLWGKCFTYLRFFLSIKDRLFALSDRRRECTLSDWISKFFFLALNGRCFRNESLNLLHRPHAFVIVFFFFLNWIGQHIKQVLKSFVWFVKYYELKPVSIPIVIQKKIEDDDKIVCVCTTPHEFFTCWQETESNPNGMCVCK